MKPINSWKILATLGLMLGTVCGVRAANGIEMTTYFPVPYVAYNTISVTDQFDVGMANNKPFTLTLGSTGTPSMEVGTMKLLKVGSGNNQLSIAPDLYSDTVTLGKENESSTATLNFSNLRIGSVGTPDKRADTLEANTVTVDGKMYMIKDAFTGGNAALPGCNDTVSWHTLTIGNTTGMFLECGGGTQPNNNNETCGEGKHWEWQLVSGMVRCSTPASTYKKAFENSPKLSVAVLANVLRENDSECRNNQGQWLGRLHRYFMPVDPNYGGNTASWCTAAGATGHEPGEGKFCLDVNSFEMGLKNESNYQIPACVGWGGTNSDFAGEVSCESGDVIWYSGNNATTSGNYDESQLVGLHKAVCVDD